METILASAFGIKPNQDISQALEKALLHLKTIPGEKTLVFEPGTYTLSAALCKKHLLYITNTAGDEEYKEDETPHLAAVGFYLGGMEDLTIAKIASVTGLPEGTVKSHLSRGKAKLSNYLKQHGYESA